MVGQRGNVRGLGVIRGLGGRSERYREGFGGNQRFGWSVREVT